MSQIIPWPLVRRQIPASALKAELQNVEQTCVLNGYAIEEWKRHFEVECRKAIGTLGEAAAMTILHDTIKAVNEEWR